MAMTREREFNNRAEEDFGDEEGKQKKEKFPKAYFLFWFKNSLCRYEVLFITQEINTIARFTLYL